MDQIGKYQIIEKIGAGGMGAIYKGLDTLLEREVAIKILRHDLSSNDDNLLRFRSEAIALGRLNHPNIASVYEFGQIQDQYFLVLEYVTGECLNSVIKKNEMLPWQLAIRYATEILNGLAHAHSFNIVHRDIKPSNIIITKNNTVKILDFGIARILEKSKMTQIGLFTGTLGYVSPEQIQGQETDARSDIYSVGIVMYEMLTGHNPFNKKGEYESIKAHIEEKPKSLRSFSNQIPVQIEQIVLKALEKKPDKRFASCEEFLLAIRDYYNPADYSLSLSTNKEYDQDNNKSNKSIKWPILSWISAWSERHFSAENPNPPSMTSMPSGECELSDRTVIRSSPKATNLKSLDDQRPPLETQDLTSFYKVGNHSEFWEIPEVVLAITQSVSPSKVGTQVSLSHFPFRIGRDPAADLVISDDYFISRNHLIVDYQGSSFTIRDAGSSNGCYINGKLLKRDQTEPLLFRDIIRLSETTVLTFIPKELQPLPDLTNKAIKASDSIYLLKKQLHSSAIADVYSAHDQKFDRNVAIKIFSPQLSLISDYMNQFKRQAEIAGRLRHPNICRIVDFGQANLPLERVEMKFSYLCMELMDGGSIASWIKEKKIISMIQITEVVSKIGDALQYIHNQSVIHCGIKPSAIVFDQDNTPYLTDFAIASQPRDRTSHSLVGAPPYLAPEQWEGKEITPSIDQYSLAVLAYFLVTSVRPYEGQENPEVRNRNYLRGPIPAHDEAARNGRTNLSREVSVVLAKGMSVKPEDRYPSIREFAHEFESAALRLNESKTIKPRVFISYHRESSGGWANFLASEFKQAHGITPFLDTQQIDTAVRFPNRLEQEITKSDVFICLLADSTLKSKWVKEEIRLAYLNKKPMLPVFLDSFSNTKPSDQLEPYIEELLNYQGIPLYEGNNPDIFHTIAVLAQMVKRTIEQV